MVTICCLLLLLQTQPATAPAAALASPEMTLQAYSAALHDCDAFAFRACVDQAGTGAGVVDAMAGWITGAGQLEAAATKAFGPEARAAMIKSIGSLCPQAVADQLNARPAQIARDDENHATAQTALGARKLVRREQGWLVILSESENAEDRADTSAALTKAADSFRAVAKQIEQGKFASADEAFSAVLNAQQ